jgi:hypothetical protein
MPRLVEKIFHIYYFCLFRFRIQIRIVFKTLTNTGGEGGILENSKNNPAKGAG